jgi:glyceraldehyde-3-phosphate dehydrogenase (NAD(P))
MVHFDLKLKRPITLPTVINKLESNPLIALTNKIQSALVFAFARDMGFLGRIINQSVVSVPSLNVKGDSEIMGFCFSPQDGNSILSSIAAAVWFFYRVPIVINCLN